MSILVISMAGIQTGFANSANPINNESPTLNEQNDKVRTFNFEMQNRKNLPLKIWNSYGKVELKNWNQKQIKVIVRVTAKNVSAKNAGEVLDRVEIEQNQIETGFEFRTKINRGNWKDMIFNGSSSVNIDYEVYLPEDNPIALSNSYGKIILSARTGPTSIKLAYGDLEATKLQHAENKIDAAYSNVWIDNITKGILKASYSKVQVKHAQEIQASLTYSSGALFEEVSKSLTGSFTYSSGLKVRLGQEIELIKISSTYSNITLLPHNLANFDFTIQTTYGSIKIPDSKTNLQKQIEKNSSKSYVGTYGRSASKGKMDIKATYGNVEIQ